MLFTTIVVILCVMNPPFVRYDDEYDSPCSISTVMTIALVMTMLAGIAPFVYDHWSIVRSVF